MKVLPVAVLLPNASVPTADAALPMFMEAVPVKVIKANHAALPRRFAELVIIMAPVDRLSFAAAVIRRTVPVVRRKALQQLRPSSRNYLQVF